MLMKKELILLNELILLLIPNNLFVRLQKLRVGHQMKELG